MKEITINGVEYKPASALAKEFKYTTDYIGQLCRAKKVDAQLIGRSWYVNPLSLKSHKKARYNPKSNESLRSELRNNIKADDEDLDENDENEFSHEVKINRPEVNREVSRTVEPVIAKATVRMSAEAEKNFAKRMDWKPLRYESDEGALLPTIKPIAPVKRLQVDLADSTAITIKKATKITYLESEALPTVSLSGSIKVTSLNEDFDEATKAEPEVTLLDIPVFEEATLGAINHHALHHSLPVAGKSNNRVKKASFVATSVKTTASFTPTLVKSELMEDQESFRVLKITLFTTSGVLVASLLMLIFGESVVDATSTTYQSEFGFTTQALTALVSLFAY